MQFTLESYKAPANRLVEAVQEHCKEIVKDPSLFAVEDFYALEERLWEFIQENQSRFPKCKRSDLKTEVFYVDLAKINKPESSFWSFQMTHKNDNIINTITLHAKY